MREIEEIKSEIKKVNTAKRNAERKRKRCVDRLEELKAELKEVANNEGI